MDKSYIEPLSQTLSSVLEQFGVQVSEYGSIQEKDAILDNSELVVIVGITGSLSGNLAYSFSKQSAKSLASAMMMGCPVEELDEMCLSALSELCNMFVGNALGQLADLQQTLEITPPSIIMGNDLYFVLGSELALFQRVETGLGPIDLTLVTET